MRILGAGTAKRLLWMLASSQLVPNNRRYRILLTLGLPHVKDSLIASDVTIVSPQDFTAGSGCVINTGVYIDGEVTLGTRVFLAPRTIIITADHTIGDEHARAGDGARSPVTIGDGCWLGAGSIILPGVTIGAGCIIGAGAVVNRNCEPNGVYVGVPARRIKDLPIGHSEAEARNA